MDNITFKIEKSKNSSTSIDIMLGDEIENLLCNRFKEIIINCSNQLNSNKENFTIPDELLEGLSIEVLSILADSISEPLTTIVNNINEMIEIFEKENES